MGVRQDQLECGCGSTRGRTGRGWHLVVGRTRDGIIPSMTSSHQPVMFPLPPDGPPPMGSDTTARAGSLKLQQQPIKLAARGDTTALVHLN